MLLTPNERQRIYEEEKARAEARERAEREIQHKKQAQGSQTCLGGCVLVFVVGIVAIIGPCHSSSTQSADTSDVASVPSTTHDKPLTAKEKKAQARQAKVEAEHERRIKAKADAEAERKAKEEYDADGLVLLLKTVSSQRGEYSGEISGTVVNRRSSTLSYVQISFGLYDKSGAKVGTAFANVNSLESGGRWKFKDSTFGTDFSSCKFSDLSGF